MKIAQCQAKNGHVQANFWLHRFASACVDNEKISKSRFTTFGLIDKVMTSILSLFALTSHYRSQLSFTWEGLNGAQRRCVD
ncbi:hypothetical protein OH492_21830 [Vibrio chagasii]|nr:hypothetical protein [Vibrio chagasii]